MQPSLSTVRSALRALLFLVAFPALLGSCGDAPPGTGLEPPGAGGPVELVNFDAAGNPLVRFDVDGDQVDLHGGEIHRFGETYYWYGETYGCGFQWQHKEPNPFCGFRVYSSRNLTDWKDRGLLFDVSSWEPWQRRCNWWTVRCFRPHLEYNRATGKYVLWVNGYDDPVNYYVLESDSPTGPFVERGLPRMAFNNDAPQGRVNNGDHNLFVDDDGTGYIVYTEWAVSRGDLVIERLTPDYLSGTGKYVRLGVSHSESPALFKRNGRYYVTASVPPNAAYGASATGYFTAPSPMGPWSRPRIISANSCGGQPFEVSELPAADGGKWYLYQSDLWLNSDGVEYGDDNQAPAAQFWAPLTFAADGSIEPITCQKSYQVDAWTALPPNPDPPAARLQCDIGGDAPGMVAREFTVITESAGRLRSVSVPVYQRDRPDAPLAIELRLENGTLLKRVEIERNGGAWDVQPNISWSARRLRVETDAVVRIGEKIAVRLSSASTRGCYGFAFRDGVGSPAVASRVSSDGGTTWSVEAGREPRAQAEVD